MIDPTELVAVARNMLGAPGSDTSEAAVRRSMSTSYYALFWALNAEVAAPFQSRVHAAAHRLAEHGVAVDGVTPEYDFGEPPAITPLRKTPRRWPMRLQ
ncbi:hypothetical protein [Candidatus Poriferisodalis sp.]|uniref:hypothetical protein n=1 Tax=Candidatus Poriferisodalis sp. TaxID=3101277 RepID=UPI003C6EE817